MFTFIGNEGINCRKEIQRIIINFCTQIAKKIPN